MVKNSFFTQATGVGRMAERAFVFTLWFTIAAGIAIAAAMAKASYGPATLGLFGTLVIGLGIPIGGIVLASRTRNWPVSLVGYLLVVLPLGYLLGPIVYMYKLESVGQVACITGGVVGCMWLLGTAIPPITRNLSGYVVAAIGVLILGNVVLYFIPSPTGFGILNWLGAFVFTGLIVYDSNRAMQMDYTVDNAIKASIGMYLDIFNLFLYLLDIFGQRKN